MLAIDLRICLVVGTISEFKNRSQNADVQTKETEPVIAPGRQIRPSSGVEKIFAKEVCTSK